MFVWFFSLKLSWRARRQRYGHHACGSCPEVSSPYKWCAVPCCLSSLPTTTSLFAPDYHLHHLHHPPLPLLFPSNYFDLNIYTTSHCSLFLCMCTGMV
ncbi:hypothetical protein F5Y07DRAFT_205107 [Xylaria sp. FL0933]|nr:hypothetical protein F5Y07DRAFT_205107 [Xylaria sp. FL0933]